MSGEILAILAVGVALAGVILTSIRGLRQDMARTSAPGIEPHKITQPIQLLAVWFASLVLLVGSFLTTAVLIAERWLSTVCTFAAGVCVLLFVPLVFLMQTRFRSEMQDDPHYSDWRKHENKFFRDFKPENITQSVSKSPRASSLDAWRTSRYKESQGLFLIHTWRPSHIPGQVADIVIQLYQHGKEGPLAQGEVEKVEYSLGPKFFQTPVIKTNSGESFRLEVSAYGPMLCAARVFVQGHETPVQLERYINFEGAA